MKEEGGMKFKRIKTTFFLVTRKRQYVLQFTLILTCPSYFDGEGVGTIGKISEQIKKEDMQKCQSIHQIKRQRRI